MATTTAERIAELARQRDAAFQAEQERIAKEQKHKQDIAAYDAQIAALQKQESREAFQAALATNQQLVSANTDAIAPLKVALDEAARLIADAMRSLLPPVQSSFEYQQAFIDGALSAAMQYANVPKPMHGNDATVDPRTVENEAHLAQRMAYGTLNKEADASGHAVPAWAALARWIADAPNETDKQIRQGVYFALFGQVITPDARYSPQAEITQQRQMLRNRRF